MCIRDSLQVVATEQLLDALALVAGEPRVVEADHAGELRHPPAPVSYTHLDVYKRQHLKNEFAF